MKSFQDTKEYIYRLLTQSLQEDKNIKCLFIHGSFVTGTSSKQAYRDERYFLDNRYLFSIIRRTEASYDVDCLLISKNQKKTAEYFQKMKFDFDGVYLTLNIISNDIYIKELKRQGTNALKRIILFKKVDILKGKESIIKGRNLLKNISEEELELNKNYQSEFDTRKKFLSILGEQGIKQIKIERQFFDQFCPIITKEIACEANTGFPAGRAKVVLPEPMGLKAKINLNDMSVVELD